ncbi:TonB-linked outer membrane protein, SusC/RagA family [Hydrobacter penzbergensis]|uniref:TonB-linked outer membrane protein, SusC/RagA family n=1 Tax=Hydrobacter penzbergensis TaxID=1235997 RepID=A0A8X8IH34_9BACT|nr:TonB-dependent receptor [Hydrobacter penzbergensis]SDX19315.1 TonB-linked outer membrane protein, SusC/RagA family [Hydrobacter penzbergensis]
MKQKNYILSFTLLLINICSLAQDNPHSVINSVLEGKIVDSKTFEPLDGVTVNIKGTTNQSISNEKGRFVLRTGQKFPYIIQLRFVGYKTSEVEATGSPINISLTPVESQLTEIVVVGYGTQKRSDVTGAIASIPKANLQQSTTSFDNLLAGSVSGVFVTQSSGQPGASSSVRVRGGNSITGGNEPLYVVDGFILYNDNGAANAGDVYKGAGVNVLSTINPSDIESVEVLKDASATAIYGSRGANGVVLITTKKGKKNKDVVSYQASIGWQEIRRKLSLLNAAQWASLRNDISASLGAAPAFTQAQIDSLGNGYDWQSAALRKGKIEQHQLSISGGDNKTKYAISGNYSDQDGILLNTGFKRYSARLNFEKTISNNFRIGTNIIASHVEQTGVTGTTSNNLAPNTWVSIIESAPVNPVYKADGGFNYTGTYSPNITNGITPNPIADLVNTTNKTIVNRTLGNVFLEYKIIPDLTAKINAGADLLFSKQNFYAPYQTSVGLPNVGYGSVGTVNTHSWQTEFTVNYNKAIGNEHFLDILGGYTTQQSNGELSLATATNFPTDLTTFNSLQSGSAGLPTTRAYTTVLNSYLGRVNYSYLHRYNLTASLRADGSSRFSPNHQWGYFPSVGLSWNVNDEGFLKASKTISNLKLRLSGGTTGNQEIGNYQYTSLLSPLNYSFNGGLITGFAPQNLPNPNLQWEKTAQYDAGIDLGLWRNRITIVADYYSKKTSNLLLNVPIPTATGYGSVLENIGSVTNRGIELTVSAEVLHSSKDGFNWRTNVTWAANRNEVTSLGANTNYFLPVLPSGTLQVLYPIIVQVGQPLGSFYGYRTDGIVQSKDNIASVPKPSWITGVYQPGDRKYVDVNHDGIINTNDRVILGSAQPKFTYGFSNTFTYKGFDLFVLLQGSYGNKIYNALQQQLEITTLSTNVSAEELNRWTVNNPSNTIPRATNAPVAVVTDRLIQDGSYARIKTLTLGYTFPIKLSQNAEPKSLRIFFSGQNLITWTQYNGYDPEVNTFEQNNLYQGVDYGAYPSAKSYSFGIGITL